MSPKYEDLVTILLQEFLQNQMPFALLILLQFSCTVGIYTDQLPTLMTFTHIPRNQDAMEKSEPGIRAQRTHFTRGMRDSQPQAA